MKKLSILLLALSTIVACKEEHPTTYLSLSGQLDNNIDSVLTISNKSGVIKKITLNSGGTFKDSLKVEKADYYTIQTAADKKAPIYLKNGYDLKLTGDSNNFMKSFTYKGIGSSSNNYILSQFAFGTSLGNPTDFFALEKDDFKNKIAAIKNGMDSVKGLYKNIDSALVSTADKQNESLYEYLEKNYDAQHEPAKKRAEALIKLAKGKVSPTFVNYENFKGGKTSLSDLKGKYVYIDFWATWCGPCRAEIPALQALEKDYHGKNIEFVSISIDNERTAKSWDKAHEKWAAMVKDKNLSGLQLFAGKDNEFIMAYQVNAIPRFVLIDPQGNIVNKDAPRPSDPKLTTLFNELGI